MYGMATGKNTLMKNLIVLLLNFILLVAFTGKKPQEKFYLLTSDAYHYPEWTDGSHYYSDLEDVFNEPSKTYYMIGPGAFDSISRYDFSKLVNLETVCIPAGILSEQPDSVRTAFVNAVKISTGKLACLSKCPKLKRIVFIIGIGTFTTEKQSQPQGKEKWFDMHYDQRQAKLELELAWKAFGSNVHQLLPGIKLYGTAEYW
jgi:hypothetical protein